MLGSSLGYPLEGAGTHKATFGINNNISRIWVEGVFNKHLTYLWSIRVSGIDQVYAHFKCAAQGCDGFWYVCWWSPDAFTGDAHCTEAQTIDLEVSTNSKHPTSFCRSPIGTTV